MLNKIPLVSLILIFCLMVNGCKESKHERIESLNSSGYYYSDTGTLNRSLWHKSGGKNVQIIPTIVIDIEYVFPYVTLIRQKSNAPVCGHGRVGLEVSDEFEYWIVNVENDSKYFFESYDEFVKKSESLNIEGIQLLKDLSYYKSQNKTVNSKIIPCE